MNSPKEKFSDGSAIAGDEIATLFNMHTATSAAENALYRYKDSFADDLQNIARSLHTTELMIAQQNHWRDALAKDSSVYKDMEIAKKMFSASAMAESLMHSASSYDEISKSLTRGEMKDGAYWRSIALNDYKPRVHYFESKSKPTLALRDASDSELTPTTETRRANQVQLYPQLFDDETPAGSARKYVRAAVGDAEQAMDAFNGGDFAALETHLAAISALMQKAHVDAAFNRAFASVLSFIRRATLKAVPAEVDRNACNALISVLNFMYSHPALDLSEAGEQVDALEDTGWHGGLNELDVILRDVFGGEEISDEAVHRLAEAYGAE